jgi:hypothetical protein
MTVLAWGAKLKPEEREKVRNIAANIGASPSHLMACMAFETGRSFAPWCSNPGSSATGLIQFMESTAQGLGTSTAALAGMTVLQQLDYVWDYFKPFRGRLGALGDVYMAILYPAAVGQPDSYPVFKDGAAAYAANKGLDVNHDGVVTKAECVAFVDKMLAEGLEPGNRSFEPISTQEPAPIEDHSPTNLPPVQQPENPMPAPLILGLISAFGPMIVDMIPAVAKLFDRKAETPEKLTAAQAVISTIVSATSSAGIDEALVKVQSNPALLETVKAKVLAEPAIAQYLTVEIGGGVAEARKADVAQQANEKPFYKTSAVFWISMLMLPMVYWYVGSSVVGGVEVPADWPWYAQVPLKMFGSAWDSGARVGLANLIVGLILGGICGVYYGISVTQNKQSGTPAKEQA